MMIEQKELYGFNTIQTIRNRSLLGAGVAFAVACLYLFGTGFHQGLWMLLPIASMVTAGAFGGLLFSLTDLFRFHDHWVRSLAVVTSLVVYLFCLWISLILSLNVTGHWD